MGFPSEFAPGPTPPPGTALFIDHGGLVLTDIHVWLIFWGSAWAGSAAPTASEVSEAVREILAGPYLSGLSQYRGIRGGTYMGDSLVADSEPPNPFSNSDVINFIHGQLANEAVPGPYDDPSILYCVVMPPGVNPVRSGVVGEHSYFVYFDLTDLTLPSDFDMARVHYAWLTNEGTLDSITTVFSHELVESCTDPNGDGFQGIAGTCAEGGWCEIGDVCTWSDVRDGVRVQAYWSDVDRACIVPGEPLPSGGPATKAVPHAPAAAAPTPLPARDRFRHAVSSSAASYVGGLLGTAWLAPLIATIVTMVAYVAPHALPPFAKLVSDSPILGGPVVGLCIWLLLAVVYAPTASARNANSGSYANLQERLTRLNARLEALPAGISETAAFREACQHRDFVRAELEACGPRWVAAVGYVTLWNRLHRAEEALIDIEPRSEVLADAYYDQSRLDDSALARQTKLPADLSAAIQYLETSSVATAGASTQGATAPPQAQPTLVQTIRTERDARAVVHRVRSAVNDYRDKRREGLVRARNMLIETMILTQLFGFGLMALAVTEQAPRDAIVAGLVFFLVGALVGLFNRLGQLPAAGMLVEDYALAGVRLVLTPTLSGLAAVGGVVLTGMLATSGLASLGTPGGAATAVTLPPLADIFDLDKFRIGLLVAVLFGGAPALLSGRLQQLTDQYKSDLRGTEASSAASAPKQRRAEST